MREEENDFRAEKESRAETYGTTRRGNEKTNADEDDPFGDGDSIAEEKPKAGAKAQPGAKKGGDDKSTKESPSNR